ncbi:MAG TPA: cadherin-like beta sandwich domain-containing protein [Treponemataceae bacterium]|jgi:hypothetical protein|nr:cadherin-like beta sandwich domain-containing protein [Treponemataceae bacterium]
MIGWVEFHHNADIKTIESTAGQVRTRSNSDTAYALGLLPTDSVAYLRVTPENPDATVSIRVDSGKFVDLPAGTYSGNVAPTATGDDHIAEVRVTSPSGKTVKTYAVRINRGETVRVNRLGIYGYMSGSVGGTVLMNITSLDRSDVLVSASVSASAFPNSVSCVFFSFPETDLYRGVKYRIRISHDQGPANNSDPCIVIPFKTDLFYDLLHDDVSIIASPYVAVHNGVWILKRNPWIDASIFEVP